MSNQANGKKTAGKFGRNGSSGGHAVADVKHQSKVLVVDKRLNLGPLARSIPFVTCRKTFCRGYPSRIARPVC
jgi:hypothetical protein